ncbi:hypothetical protein L218DRAFT_924789 [Marasmius fiardii PR-910]|nr:hypothetical protein L218DRAFT_924789 [Marasmius fiardii PR-910]
MDELAAPDERPRPVFIFSNSRTRSNLLTHLLSTHPLIGESLIYPFMPAHGRGPERRLKGPSLFLAKEISAADTYQNCYDTLQRKIQQVHQQGRIPLCKEHAFIILSGTLMNKYTPGLLNETHPVIVDKSFQPEYAGACSSYRNPTILPDRFMANVTPIVLIRHPTRLIDSGAGCVLRGLGGSVDDPGFLLSCTLKWQRIVFDYYRDFGDMPIVIDGDEMVNGDSKDLLKKLCTLIGIDGSLIQYEWKPKASYMSLDGKLEEVYRRDFYQSTRIVKDKEVKPPALEDKVRKWEEEWGEEVARRLKGFVEESMEDYTYLFQFHIR